MLTLVPWILHLHYHQSLDQYLFSDSDDAAPLHCLCVLVSSANVFSADKINTPEMPSVATA